MGCLLFPGRHLAHTRFQVGYVQEVLRTPPSGWRLFERPRDASAWQAFCEDWTSEPPCVAYAVTSANQQNSRYNPAPFYLRALGVDRFHRELSAEAPCGMRLFGVPHFPPTPKFAERVLREVEEQSEGECTLTPRNTAVLCSTAELMRRFADLGFAVLPVEQDDPSGKATTPIEVVRRLAETGDGWPHDATLVEWVSASTVSLWRDFPDFPRRTARLYRDPLLTEQGGLTETRDYLSYAQRMSNPQVVEFKYRDVRQALVEGRIVDEGCADGALLVPIARDFPDSDLLGVEITSEFLAQCRERQRRGDFGGAYVHFHQRNLMEDVFEPGSIQTTLCNSTTHELWSYGDREATLLPYLARKFRQTAVGGRLVIRDVVGPTDGQRQVLLWCRADDGRPSEEFPHAEQHPLLPCGDGPTLERLLQALSTAGRFRRFAHDFLAEERAEGRRGEDLKAQYEECTVDGRVLFRTRLRDAAEFLGKMDYLDNWRSEMHEEFAFWSFDQWRDALRGVGFAVVEDLQAPLRGSRAYLNPWIAENRYAGRVALFDADDPCRSIPFPPTNMVLVGERRTAE